VSTQSLVLPYEVSIDATDLQGGDDKLPSNRGSNILDVDSSSWAMPLLIQTPESTRDIGIGRFAQCIAVWRRAKAWRL